MYPVTYENTSITSYKLLYGNEVDLAQFPTTTLRRWMYPNVQGSKTNGLVVKRIYASSLQDMNPGCGKSARTFGPIATTTDMLDLQ